MPFWRPFFLSAAIMAGAAAGCVAVFDAPAPTSVSLTTGTPGGVYHPVGNAICRMFNLEAEHQAIPCVAVSSDGSVANIRRVESGDSAFGLSQTDVAYAAFHGQGPFAAGGPAFTRKHLPSSLAPIPAYAISRTCVPSASALARAVSATTSRAMSSSKLMAGRRPILSMRWNSRLPSRTWRSAAARSMPLYLKRGIPMG